MAQVLIGSNSRFIDLMSRIQFEVWEISLWRTQQASRHKNLRELGAFTSRGVWGNDALSRNARSAAWSSFTITFPAFWPLLARRQNAPGSRDRLSQKPASATRAPGRKKIDAPHERTLKRRRRIRSTPAFHHQAFDYPKPAQSVSQPRARRNRGPPGPPAAPDADRFGHDRPCPGACAIATGDAMRAPRFCQSGGTE